MLAERVLPQPLGAILDIAAAHIAGTLLIAPFITMRIPDTEPPSGRERRRLRAPCTSLAQSLKNDADANPRAVRSEARQRVPSDVVRATVDLLYGYRRARTWRS